MDIREEKMDTDKHRETLWVHCPICGNKTRTKVCADTVVVHFPLYCPKCRKESLVNIAQLKMIRCDEPNA